MALTAGTKLGPYEIVAPLGAGGMGEVYRARDLRLGRDVAIKVLPNTFLNDADRLARFQREAQLLAALNHPNIAAIYGLEESGSVRALVMELVEGPTLAARVQAGPIPLDEALGIARQIAEALEYAHERGIVHRDLKPANVKLKPDGTVKVLDFGLAKVVEGDSAASDLANSPTITRMETQAGIILGTAAYMSPEQAKGKGVDRRADVWAFGCVLYEMLAGKAAFRGETVTETLAGVIKEDPRWTDLPPAMPPRIHDLLHRCLKKDAKQRLQSIGDARIALAEAITGAPQDSFASATTARPAWQRALPWAVAGVLALALGAALLQLRRPVREVQPVVRLVIPLSMSNETLDVALSPNGARLAYGNFKASGGFGLQWRDLSQPDSREVSGLESPRYPFFSPDGQRLAAFSGGKLVKVDLPGGSPHVICEAPIGLGGSWGADGTIVFANELGLFAVSDEGGQPRPLVQESKGTFITDPQILPGGKQVLFSTVTEGETARNRTWVVPLRPGSKSLPATMLLENAQKARLLATGELLFVRDRALNAVLFDLQNLRVTGPATSLQIPLAGSTLGTAEYSVSDNGTLAYTLGGSAASNYDLVWVDRAGKVEQLPMPEKLYSDPQISPDGQRIVIGIGTTPQQNLWLFDFKRHTLSRLTSEYKSDYAPVWTPDGKRIMFSSPGLPWRMFSVPADGSGPEKQLMTLPLYTFFATSFSPDGRHLALSTLRQSHFQIDILNFKDGSGADPDGQPVPFVESPFNKWRPQFSRDGHWIAYSSDEAGQYQIYVRPYPGPGAQVQVSDDGGDEPRWSRDGREMFYRNGDRMMAVKVVTGPNFSAGRPQLLFRGEYLAPGAVLNYDVTPDGRRFLMQKRASNTVSPEVDVLVNWGDQMRKQVQTGK